MNMSSLLADLFSCAWRPGLLDFIVRRVKWLTHSWLPHEVAAGVETVFFDYNSLLFIWELRCLEALTSIGYMPMTNWHLTTV